MKVNEHVHVYTYLGIKIVAQTRVGRMILDDVVFKVHFVLRGRDKPWNILPGSNGPFFPKHLRRTFDVSIYIVTHPNKHLGIKLYNRIPNGLRIQQTQRDRVLFINLPKSQIKLNEIRFITS